MVKAMISGLAWIPVVFLLVILQKATLDVFSFYLPSVEFSLLFVVFAGFSMSITKGTILTLIVGFFVETMTGTVTGLFMFVYFLLFFVSSLVSTRVYIGQPYFILLFIVFCALLEGILLLAINRYVLGVSSIYPTLLAVSPQVIILGTVSPFFFNLFRKFEVLVHAKTAQPN